jgi:poly(A) polymerase
MLKKLIRFFSNNKTEEQTSEPHTLSPGEHAIKPGDISKGAATVVRVLEEKGFQAYVVGGCVRDLLLDLHPKDFDVATNATPEEVKPLFRRARIIGRRFRIVHVHIGREMVEVTTFRANHTEDDGRGALRSDEGRLLRDNTYGDITEDASRRDFTINALYYHPGDNTLFDYANGLRDIEKRQLRVIGDPETRFREDPVRMLRAVRFAAKLGFAIEPDTARAIHQLAPLLADIPPARLFDEFLKLFLSGHGLATFNLLRQYGLFASLFPQTEPHLEDQEGFALHFVEQALINTDQRIRTNKRVTPAFLLAALLWPPVEERRRELEAGGEPPPIALNKAAGKIISVQVGRIAIPRRFSQPMREIWELQLRLPKRHGKRAEHLVSLPRFRAGYDFVLLREQAGENLDDLGLWWTRYQEADEEKRQAMVRELGGNGGRKKRRRRPRKKPAGDTQTQ